MNHSTLSTSENNLEIKWKGTQCKIQLIKAPNFISEWAENKLVPLWYEG